MPQVTRPAFDTAYAVKEAQICNIALGHIGAELIKDTDEDSKQSRACRAVYAQTRDELLRTYPFNFATKITKIPIDSAYENPLDEFLYAYKAEDWRDFDAVAATTGVITMESGAPTSDTPGDFIGREVVGAGIPIGARVIAYTVVDDQASPQVIKTLTIDKAPAVAIGSVDVTDPDNPVFTGEIAMTIHIPLLKILELAANDNNIYEVVGGGRSRRILTNVGDGATLELKYVEQVLDPDKFDSMFAHALALRIASKIAIDLTKNMAVVQMLQQEFSAIFQAAKVSSSEERQIDSPDPWWTDRQMGTQQQITRR